MNKHDLTSYIDTLSACRLFTGIDEQDLPAMLTCLDGNHIHVKKGNPIFVEGDPARFIGIILTGTAQVIREDYYGHRSIMTDLQPGDLFAEAFSCAGLSAVPISVFAMTDSDILLLDCHHLLTSCSNSCDFHNTLIRNLLYEIARKNLALNQKIRYMSEKTTRDKLMAYLSDQAKQNHSDTFTIPFNRQALADYLGVERSAMSAEISKLKKGGIIDTQKSTFRLL